MTPKSIHKILIPKYIHFLKTPKNIEIQNFEPQKMTRACKPPGATVCQIITPNIIISSTFDEVSHAIKKKSCGTIKIVTEPTG